MSPATTLPPFPEPPALCPRQPRVSIVVTNRNYEQFLPVAIDSALTQRGADVEVVVVDDGSSDGSRAVISRYGGRLHPVMANGEGQKAAFNAGLAASTGDVVLFLDADDVLDQGIVASVVAAFTSQPRAARVVFRLRVVDEHGLPTGACVPSTRIPLPCGDVRRAVLSFPDDLAWPPTSGNAFAAWALRRVMPLPVDGDRTGADSMLHPLIPLLGPVVRLDRVGGAYRLHGRNAHLRDRLDVDRSRLVVRRAQRTHSELDRLARDLGYGAVRPRSVTIAAHRLVSLRLGGRGHPVRGDSRQRALKAGLRAAAGRTDVGLMRRAAYAVWFLAAALGPRRAVRFLSESRFQDARGDRPAWRAPFR